MDWFFLTRGIWGWRDGSPGPFLSRSFFFRSSPPAPRCIKKRSAQARRKWRSREAAFPNPGTIKSVDGVEYIYGKNRRFRNLPEEPEYVWIRKDQYRPRPFDALQDSLSNSADNRKEIEDLEKRIARLEAEIRGLSPVPEGTGERRPENSAPPAPDGRR